MSERQPNWAIEIKRIQVELGQDKQNILRDELKIMDLEEELSRVRTNIAGTQAAMPAKTQKLAALIEEHGEKPKA